MSRRYELIKPLLPIVLTFNVFIRYVAALTHRFQYALQWGTMPVPEWFDTNIGLYYRWRADKVSWIWDRGVFSTLSMPENARVLDICCGGGFFTRYFYAGRSREVVGVDFDPKAINFARKRNSAPNVRYEIHDIRDSLPEGPFDAVVWDGAVEHFTPEEIAKVCAMVKERMTANAILSCYTIQQKADGTFHHPLHEYEFSSKADLAQFFMPHFKNVKVFETTYNERHNLHLWASDGLLPFDDSSPYSARFPVIAG